MKILTFGLMASLFINSTFAQEASQSGDNQTILASVVGTRPLPAGAAIPRVKSLPFSASDAIRYFSKVMTKPPQKLSSGATVFETQHDPLPEDRCTIEVRTDGDVLIIEFKAGGNVGLSHAREFFESRLFEPDETQRFYAMLSDAEKGPVEKLRRFTVGMTSMETKSSFILLLRFTPL
jgi:hypothetical protein